MLVGTRYLWNCIPSLFDRSTRATPRLILSLVLPCLFLAGSLCPASAQSTLTTVHSFGAGTDGSSPSGPLIVAADNSFVGTTEDGGANGTGCVYNVTTSGVVTILYSFSAGTTTTVTTGTSTVTNLKNADGAYPSNGVILGTDGNYYGSTTSGGTYGYGTIFMLTPAGALTTLYDFMETDGAVPSGLVESSTAGTFYGVCQFGGQNDNGTIFSLTVSNGVGTLATLYTFSALDVLTFNNTDGANPASTPIIGTDGNLYGTTSDGGNSNVGVTGGLSVGIPGGTIWKYTPPTTSTTGSTAAGTFSVLYTFTALTINSTNTFGINTDGTHPIAGLVQISDGTLVGSCSNGGSNGTGTIFDVSTTGTYRVLHIFGALTSALSAASEINFDGIAPSTSVVQPTAGTIYGTCELGGSAGNGTVFKIDTTTTTPTFTLIYAFGAQSSSIEDGSEPEGGLIAEDGNIYGTTSAGGAYAGATGLGGILFEVQAVPPTTSAGLMVTSLSPATVPAGSAALTLTVNGTGFDAKSVVEWETPKSASGAAGLTQALATTYVSSTQLMAVVPAFLLGIDATLNRGATETATVTVVNTDTNTTTAANSISMILLKPATSPPRLTGLSLPSITAGSAATSVTISGNGFYTGDTVTIGGTPLTPTAVTSMTVTVTVPASLLTKAQNLPVTVASSAGASNALLLTVGPVTTFFGGLQLIALPYDYVGDAPSAIFGYSSPKLAVWNAAAGIYAVTPTAPADTVRLGRGYWIRFPTVTNVILAGTSAPAGAPYSISLSKGWNMIGDPFTTLAPGTGITVVDSAGTAYTFGDAATAGIINSSTYSYDPASNGYVLETTGDMQPYTGYWIFADAPCTLEVNGS